MIADPFKLRLGYLIAELGSFSDVAIVQIWTPHHLPFAGVTESKMDTQVMQTCHHPFVLGDAAFQDFRTKSCKQGITGQALGMLGKVWCSGVLQVVQDVSIVPHGVHPRNKLEHLRRGPGGPGLMESLAEIVYIPIYDETDPDAGVIAVLEALLAAGGSESLLANVISGVGNVLAELQLSLSKPDPDAEVPEPGSMPPVLIPSEPWDMAAAPPPAAPSAFADEAGRSLPGGSLPPSGPPGGGHAGSWGGRRGSSHLPSPAVSPRQSSLRSYGTPPHPLTYGSPPQGPIRYGFLETAAMVPRPGSPQPCAASDVMAALYDFAGLSFAPPPGAAGAAAGWAAVADAAREAAARPPGGHGPSPAASFPPYRPCPPRPAGPAKQSQLTRTLSRTPTARFLDALEQEALPLPCPYSKAPLGPKPACGGKGLGAHRPTLAA